jgi:hypothetical protein
VLHTGFKRFSCSKCGKVFARKEAAVEHIRSVHVHSLNKKSPQQQTPPPPNQAFPCDLCDNAFQQRVHLNQHMKSYHGVSAPSGVSDQAYQQPNMRLEQVTRNRNTSGRPEIRRNPVQNPQVNNNNRPMSNNPRSLLQKPRANNNSHTVLNVPMKTERDVNRSLGNLMGLINRGSLSLSVTTTGQN